MKRLKGVFLRNEIVKALRIKSFALLMLSEFFSQLAFNMQHFVLIFLLFNMTHSNSSVSGLILSFSIPAVLCSLVSGVYIDRWSKKKVLFYGNLLRGLLIIPFIYSGLSLPVIYTLTFAIAVVTQFFVPAEYSIMPELVPKKMLVAANAIFSLGLYSSVLLGYILSGPALLILGRQNTIAVLAVLFFISTIFITLIKSKEKKTRRGELGIVSLERSVAREISEVLRFVRKTKKIINAFTILTISQSILFMFAVLGPGFMTQVLGVRVENLSLIVLAPAAVGIGLGGFLIGSYGGKLNFKILNVVGFALSGIVFIMMPYVGSISGSSVVKFIEGFAKSDIGVIHVAIFLAFIAGLANAMVFIPANVIIQTHTHEEMRGRVYGFLNALTGAVSLLPVALVGGLADQFGVNHIILGVGLFMVILSFVFYLFD